MSEQHDSLLFRIPRELRDKIYYYYVLEEDGYHHDSTPSKLRLVNGDSINLSLQSTCKRVATEMDGLAFEVNTITFRTTFDMPNTAGQYSNAALFDYHLKQGRERLLRRMLEFSRTLVTPEVMRRFYKLYPHSLAVKKMEEVSKEDDVNNMYDGRLWGSMNIHVLDYNFVSAQPSTMTQDLLQIISDDPIFWHLTATGYDTGIRFTGTAENEPEMAADVEAFARFIQSHDTLYTSKEMQQRVLDWRPDLRWIHNCSDLDAIAEL